MPLCYCVNLYVTRCNCVALCPSSYQLLHQGTRLASIISWKHYKCILTVLMVHISKCKWSANFYTLNYFWQTLVKMNWNCSIMRRDPMKNIKSVQDLHKWPDQLRNILILCIVLIQALIANKCIIKSPRQWLSLGTYPVKSVLRISNHK